MSKFCGKKRVHVVKDRFNPFKLNSEHLRTFGIDPFANKYVDCVKYIDQVCEKICIKSGFTDTKIQRKIICDYTKPSEFLFKHGPNTFMGYRDVVYDQILVFKDMKDMIQYDNQITLEGNLPKEIINQYIDSSHTGVFDINQIDTKYFFDFLRFIDQYPMVNLTVKTLEQDIIKYISDNKQINVLDEYLKELCDKYQMKGLYIQIHNAKCD